jgi:polar amino acid transport system substrate-binding protein
MSTASSISAESTKLKNKIINLAKNLFTKSFYKKKRNLIWIILTFLVLAFTIRSCTKQKEVRKHLYLIGRDSSWYPLELYGKEKNMTAFTNDLMTEIVKISKIRMSWVETGPGTLQEGLDSGSYDGILTSSRIEDYLADQYLSSQPIYKLGLVLIVQRDSNVTSAKEMKGKTVGISSTSPLVINAIRQGGVNPYDVTFVTYNNMNRGLEALSKGSIDGVVLEALPAYTLVNALYVGKLKVATGPLTEEGIRLVTLNTPSSEVLVNDVNTALQTLKENGTYDKLLLKWNLVLSQVVSGALPLNQPPAIYKLASH